MIQPLIEAAKRRLAEHQAEVDRLTKFLEAYEQKEEETPS